MIIGKQSQILDATAFATGLQRSVRGVVRVSSPPGPDGQEEGRATGWLITDALVVLPVFVLSGESGYRCRFATEPEEEVEADLVPGPPGDEKRRPARSCGCAGRCWSEP